MPVDKFEEEIRQFKKMFHQMYRLHRWMIFFLGGMARIPPSGR